MQPWTGRQKLLVGLVASTVVLDGADNQLLGITIPALMGEWAVSRAAFAPVLASGLIGMLIGGAAAGLIGDRLGRKRALLGSVAVFGALTLADLRSDQGSSRARFLRSMLASSIESIGAIATGVIALAFAVLLLCLAWKPKQAKAAA